MSGFILGSGSGVFGSEGIRILRHWGVFCDGGVGFLMWKKNDHFRPPFAKSFTKQRRKGGTRILRPSKLEEPGRYLNLGASRRGFCGRV